MKTRLQTLSYDVAKSIVRLTDVLIKRKISYPLVHQLLKSGTSIAANIAESRQAQSRPDFATKLAIASKEAQETLFWLMLLHDTDKVTSQESATLIDQTEQLCRMLSTAARTLKK
jgi:four helix bundle protein